MVEASEHDAVRVVLSGEKRNGLTTAESRETVQVLGLHQAQYERSSDLSSLHARITCIVDVGQGGRRDKESIFACTQHGERRVGQSGRRPCFPTTASCLWAYCTRIANEECIA